MPAVAEPSSSRKRPGHPHDPDDLELVFVVAKEWLPGEYTHPETKERVKPVDRSAWTLEQFEKAGAVSALTFNEQVYLLSHRIVLSHTYSMQQTDFERHGFEVSDMGGRKTVLLDSHVQIVGLGTADRYSIFGARTPDGFRMPDCFDDHAEWLASDYSYDAYRNREIAAASS